MTVRSRAAVVAAGAVAVAFAAAGCTPDGEVPPEHDSSSASAAAAHLRVAVYGPPAVRRAYRTVMEDFHREHPQVTVDLEAYKSEAAELRAVRKDAAGGRAPDLFLTGVDALTGLLRDRLVQPVAEPLAERQLDFGDGYPRSAIEEFSSDSTLQCMPTEYSPMVVYYNPDLVDLDQARGDGKEITATRGWGMEQFTRAAQNVVADGHAGAYIAPTVDQLASFVMSEGGTVVDNVEAPTTTAFGSSDSVDAISQVLHVMDLNRGIRSPSSPAQALRMFENGKLGMLLGYRDLTGVLRKARTARQLNFDVLPLPDLSRRKTTGELAGFCMSTNATDADASADLLAHIVGKHAMSVLARSGYVMPTNLDVASSNAFWQPRKRPASASVFTTQLRRIEPLPLIGIWPRVESLADRHLSSIFAHAGPEPDQDRLERLLTVLDEDTAAVLNPQPQSPGASVSSSASPSTTP